MDVVETYHWDAGEATYPRRDKRRGVHHGKAYRTVDKQAVIEARWDDPYGGWCADTFILSQDGLTLEQITEMKMNDGKECKYKTVFKRKI